MKLRPISLVILVLASAAVARSQCVPSSNAAGTLDTCFGNGGKVMTDVTSDRDFARAVAIQTDGKIVVAGIAGYSATSNTADFLVIRYNTDGSLDTTFDGDGIVVTDFGLGTIDDDYCRGVVIQPDGKIVIAGRAFIAENTYAFALIRYNTDGSLDSTFDGDGKAQFAMSAIVEMYGLALQPDGRMIVAGRSFLNNTFTGLIARFHSNGSLDTSFGTNGSATGGMSGIFSIALMPDGRILAAGTEGPDATAAFAVSRLHNNGTLDPTFGSGGVMTHHPTLTDHAWFVRVRPDNQIFVGGHSFSMGSARGALLRLNLDGTIAQSLFDPNENAFWNIAFQPDGKQITVGQTITPASGFTLRRFTAINLPDATFNGGATYVKFLPAAVVESSGVNALAMTRDNKVVAVGSVTEADNHTAGYRIAVARLNTGLQAPHPERFDFDGDRRADPSIFRASNSQWWHLRSSDGGNSAATFGAASDSIVPGDYTGDGKTDIAVWRPSSGVWFILRSEDSSFFSIPFGTSGDIPRPADFDGDGKTDFIVYRPSENYFYRTTGNGVTSVRHFGIPGDKTITGDFDGDGKSDPAIFRPSAGEFWYESSINLAHISARWGTDTDIPVPADFDGDGKTDVAVWRPSNGTWYIANSSNGSQSVVAFGLSDDKPVAADYDGDGRSDIAVFRPSNGVWYLLRSTAGFAAIPFGLSTDKPVPAAFVE